MDISEHSINRFETYGQLSGLPVPEWAEPTLKSLYNDAEPYLDGALHSAISAKNQDLSEYTDKIQDEKRGEILIKPRNSLHETLRKHMTRTKENRQRIEDKTLALTLPKRSEDPAEQIRLSLRQQEIRQILRSEPDLEKRKELISENKEYLQAVSEANDNIINPETLTALRRAEAYREDQDLEKWSIQTQAIEKLVRRKCGELNASQIAIYSSEDLTDPLSRQTHFETFTPRSNFEGENAESLINGERDTTRRIDSKNNSFEDVEDYNGNH